MKINVMAYLFPNGIVYTRRTIGIKGVTTVVNFTIYSNQNCVTLDTDKKFKNNFWKIPWTFKKTAPFTIF